MSFRLRSARGSDEGRRHEHTHERAHKAPQGTNGAGQYAGAVVGPLAEAGVAEGVAGVAAKETIHSTDRGRDRVVGGRRDQVRDSPVRDLAEVRREAACGCERASSVQTQSASWIGVRAFVGLRRKINMQHQERKNRRRTSQLKYSRTRSSGQP
jgi:hypothetical protein